MSSPRGMMDIAGGLILIVDVVHTIYGSAMYFLKLLFVKR